MGQVGSDVHARLRHAGLHVQHLLKDTRHHHVVGVRVQLESSDRDDREIIDLAIKAFELSQSLTERERYPTETSRGRLSKQKYFHTQNPYQLKSH